nr:hypothetical protein [Saccharospirillum impatiens]
MLEIGFDNDGNNVLDDDEVQQTQEVCNGSNGTDGTNGTDGENGTDGTDGSVGLNALVRLTEVAGVSVQCPIGGMKIESGLDANADNVLDVSEVNPSQTQYVCHGDDGENSSDPGLSSLVETLIEPAGANCTNGGIRVDSGVDTSGDGVLQEAEKSAPVYVCNVAGATGSSSLIELSVELPGGNCTYGGTRIDSGPDADSNGSLEPGEISQTRFVCEQQSCSWTDNNDGTTTVSCEGEDDRLVLNPEALSFTSRTTCSVSIDHPEVEDATVPLIYTIDAIGNDLKFVTLNVLDGDVQVTNSRLVTSTAANSAEFNFSIISVYFDTLEEATNGRYQASLNETENEMALLYFDSDLTDGGPLGGMFPAFSTDTESGVCSRVLSVAD